MKKNVIALAVAAAIAAPMAASADATIYGRLHADIGSVSDGDKSTTAITSNASRIGFKGSEDLGGGLKAIWQIESQISGDSDFAGGGSFASRNTFVGLSGNWGTAVLGKHDTPYKVVGRKADLFGDQYGDSRALTNLMKSDARAPNVIGYIAPNMGGFGIFAAYHTDNDNADTNGDAYAINLTYKSDMFWVGGAYQKFEESNAFAIYDDGTTAGRIAGYVKLAGFKITADITSQEAKAKGGDKTALDTYGIGASYTIGGKHVIKGQYFGSKIKDTVAAVTSEAKPSTASIGYDYKLSKKSTVGAYYSQVSNKDGSDVALWKSPVGAIADKNPTAFAAYLKVNF